MSNDKNKVAKFEKQKGTHKASFQEQGVKI